MPTICSTRRGTMLRTITLAVLVAASGARAQDVTIKLGTLAPQDAASAKFFAWDGDPGSIEAFKAVGWRPVVLASTDIVPSLQTGMINCVAQVLAFVLTGRLFEKANHMVDFPWSYLVGATVVK